jgi:hypothetical protein
MNNLKREFLADIPFNATSPQAIDLVAKTLTDEILLDIKTDLVVSAGAASGAVLAEGTLAMVDTINIYEAGEPIVDISARALGQISERESAKARSGVDLPDGTAQTISLRQQVRLRFASPLLANPMETALRPVDPKKKFTLSIKWAPVLKTVLVNATNDRVFTFSNTVCRVSQVHDPVAYSSFRPIYLPRIKRDDTQITAAAAALPVTVDTNQRIRALMLHQISDTVSTDMITQFTLKDDGREYFTAIYRETQHEAEQADYGGATDQAGYMFFNLARFGRLGNTWSPGQGAHLRFTCAVTHPGTTDLIRCHRIELVKVPGITADKDF